MSKVYFLCWKESPNKPTYSVFSRNKTGIAHELIPVLDGKNEYNEEFYFRKIFVGQDGLVYEDTEESDPVWQDYPPNEFAWPIVSEKLHNIIINNTSHIDEIDFIKISISHFGKANSYYILRFNKLHDIIDVENTLYVEGTNRIIRPCFKEIAFDNIQIASKPDNYNLWKITSGIYVSDKFRKEIIREKIDGIEFSRAKSK